MEMDPSDERAVQAYAQAVSTLGDKDEAIRTWEKWTESHPKDGEALSMIAMYEDAKGDQSKAIETYKRALLIDSTPGAKALASNNLAYLMVTSGQNADVALSYAQAARRTLPNSPNTADTLAWVYYYKGTYLSARDLLESAQKQDPQNASIQYHLGMTYSKLGRKADAIVQLKKAAASDPKSDIGKLATTALGQMG
jgi:tetratricopeptide (TPR) repeat protein